MSVIFSESSGLNDSLWKPIGQVLSAVIKDADNEKNDYDKFLEDVFLIKKSNKYAEKTTGLTALGNMTPVDEGDATPMDSIHESEPKLVIHGEFKQGFFCTERMREDADIDVMKTAAQNLVLGYKRTKAQIASDALTCAAASFMFNGKRFDSTTGDTKALFSTDHAGHQSNVFTNAFGTTSAMLNKLAIIGRNIKDASGHEQGFTFNEIIIPANCDELEDTVRKVIRSDLTVGSNFNDINTQKGLWKLIVDPCWHVEGNKAPYIITSSQARKSLMASMFYNRTPLKIRKWVDENTGNLNFASRARFVPAFRDWRAFILGGADFGTQL